MTAGYRFEDLYSAPAMKDLVLKAGRSAYSTHLAKRAYFHAEDVLLILNACIEQ